MLSNCLPADPALEDTEFCPLWVPSSGVGVMDRLHPRYAFIMELYIDHNNLVSLNGVQQFSNLEVFSFRFNNVSRFEQLARIRNSFFLKKLGIMGNPLEEDRRARWDYLKLYLFSNLESLNLIPHRKSRHTALPATHKAPQKMSPEFQKAQSEGITQRYRPKHPKSIMNHTLTKISIGKTILQNASPSPRERDCVQNTSIKSFIDNHRYQDEQKSRKKGPAQRSTTAQHTRSFIGRQNEAGRNSLTTDRMEHSTMRVKVTPFLTVDEAGERQLWRQAREDDQEDQQDEGLSSESSIQQSSSFMRHQAGKVQLFSSGRTPSRPSKLAQHSYRNIVQSFLEQQKIDIACAFRNRVLKQKSFAIWMNLHHQAQQDELILKRKAWATIKLSAAVDKVFAQRQPIKQ